MNDAALLAGRKPVLAFAHANGVPGHSYDTFLDPLRDHYDVRVVECLGQDPRYPVDANWESLSLELELAKSSNSSAKGSDMCIPDNSASIKRSMMMRSKFN